MAGLADFSRSRGLAVVWAAGSVIGDGVGQMLQTSATLPTSEGHGTKVYQLPGQFSSVQ